MLPRSGQTAERLLHAELASPQHQSEQVLVHVILLVCEVEDLLVPLRHVRGQGLGALGLEVPVAHREVLQHFHPHRDALLNPHHARHTGSIHGVKGDNSKFF